MGKSCWTNDWPLTVLGVLQVVLTSLGISSISVAYSFRLWHLVLKIPFFSDPWDIMGYLPTNLP